MRRGERTRSTSAISINQTDDAMRSSQVQLMASIYSSASSVAQPIADPHENGEIFLATSSSTTLNPGTPYGPSSAATALPDCGSSKKSSWHARPSCSAATRQSRGRTSSSHLEFVSHLFSTNSWLGYFPQRVSFETAPPGSCHYNMPTILKANKVSRRESEGYAKALAHALVRTRHFRATDLRQAAAAAGVRQGGHRGIRSLSMLEIRALKIDVIRKAAETKHEIYSGAPFPTMMKILVGEGSREDGGVLNAFLAHAYQ
ncbi:hypothetical protein CORC01_02353 [Colletotrichum orchidophilum]|uniref:Heterokaryon incompatibility domain-containing protein n=1 Tax=Colletotrichum orchidophilum TaxID=1209926 RepID=A0A1G4BLK8_9PEZI|nr:uncharacterized protein CORC01_02353 [Colletotrichum orchidophilum]OHF02360.1 hypothetical protein CORC01_02353 [Colletotrichum orchidophilum]